MRWRAASWPKNAEFPWAGRRSRTAAVPGIPSWVHHCYPVIKHGNGNQVGEGGAISDILILSAFKEGVWESRCSPADK